MLVKLGLHGTFGTGIPTVGPDLLDEFLQPIPKNDPLFVTLNSTQSIREDLIYDQTTLRHPYMMQRHCRRKS